MSIRPTSDGAAIVDTTHHWIAIEDNPPPAGAKVLLINRRYGVALLSLYRKADDWTHWYPLPKFKDKEKETWTSRSTSLP